MAIALATLEISIVAKLASLEASFEKAARDAETTGQRMTRSFEGTKDAVFGLARDLAALYGVRQFVSLISGALEAEAALVHLSKATQLSIEQIGGLSFAAKQSGGNAEEAAVAIGRLNISIAKAQAGDAKAADSFSTMGISVRGLGESAKTADQILIEMGEKFATYAEGPEKAALAQAKFGRGYQAVMAMLDQGSGVLQSQIDFWNKYSGVTADSAEAAHQFEQRLGELNVLSKSFVFTLANDMVPTLTAVVNALIGVKEGSTNAQSAAHGLATVFDVVVNSASYLAQMISEIGLRLAHFAATATNVFNLAVEAGKIAASPTLHPGDALKGVYEAYDAKERDLAGAAKERMNSLREGFNKFREDMNTTLKPSGIDFGQGKTDRGQWGDLVTAPSINPHAGAQSDTAKAVLDAALKVQEEFIKSDIAQAAQHNKILDGMFAEHLVSIGNYYFGKQAIDDEALASELSHLDREIRLIQERIKSGLDPTHAAEESGKIATLIERKAQLVAAATAANIELGQKATATYVDYAKKVSAVDVEVLTLQGHLTEAADIKFTEANSVLRLVFGSEHNDAALRNIDLLQQHNHVLSQIAEISRDATLASDQLALAEDRIALSVVTGERTSLEAMIATGHARAAALDEAERLAVALQKAADADPFNRPELAVNAARAQLAFEKLKASVDPLAASLNVTFAGDFTTAMNGFVQGTMTAGQAFSSFAMSVIGDIEKILSKQLADKLFGGSGGMGGFFAALLGSGLGAGGGGTIAGGSGFHFASGGFLKPFGMAQVNESGVEGLTVNGKDYIMAGASGARVVASGRGAANGPTFNISIAAGVGRSELAGIIPALTASIKAQIRDEQHRPGGSYA